MTSLQPARHAVVLGGTGYVGSHVVEGLLAAGAARVTVPTRRSTDLPAWADDDRVVLLQTDVSTPDGSTYLGRVLDDAPPVTFASASVGGWWEGPHLVDLDADTWDGLLRSNLTSHWLAARAVVPHLDPAGSAYVTTNGIATVQPEAASGPVSVTGAAQTMLLDVLRAEESREAVRFHELCIVNPIVDDGQAEHADEAVVEIGDVVARVLALGAGSDAGAHQVRLGRL
ncbi:SDR family NAD(P)-dependent oxidoreductase [Solicola sp. PLA-1-18]|uniref:SDR family NAD(P)-dependent oxidoreductase n=1 Tax=Solicola sp. PLA-1-18 TaxID=3380532 RepID=UPI003B7F4500